MVLTPRCSGRDADTHGVGSIHRKYSEQADAQTDVDSWLSELSGVGRPVRGHGVSFGGVECSGTRGGCPHNLVMHSVPQAVQLEWQIVWLVIRSQFSCLKTIAPSPPPITASSLSGVPGIETDRWKATLWDRQTPPVWDKWPQPCCQLPETPGVLCSALTPVVWHEPWTPLQSPSRLPQPPHDVFIAWGPPQT